MKKILFFLILLFNTTLFSNNTNKDSPLNGRKLHFYKSGNLKAIEDWKNGKLTGKFIIYSEDGTKILENHYLNGKNHGKYIIFHDSGYPYINGSFSFGAPTGIWYYYDTNGNLTSKHSPEKQKK